MEWLVREGLCCEEVSAGATATMKVKVQYDDTTIGVSTVMGKH